MKETIEYTNTTKELLEKVNNAHYELRSSGLDLIGYRVEIELSISSYRDLVAERQFSPIRLEVDTPTEKIHRGTVFGVPCVITQDTDRVLIAREVK